MTIWQEVRDDLNIYPGGEAALIRMQSQVPLQILVRERRNRIGRAVADFVDQVEPGGGDVVAIDLEVDHIEVHRVRRPLAITDEKEVVLDTEYLEVSPHIELFKLNKEKA